MLWKTARYFSGSVGMLAEAIAEEMDLKIFALRPWKFLAGQSLRVE